MADVIRTELEEGDVRVGVNTRKRTYYYTYGEKTEVVNTQALEYFEAKEAYEIRDEPITLDTPTTPVEEVSESGGEEEVEEDSNTSFECPECGKEYQSEHYYEQHVAGHEDEEE